MKAAGKRMGRFAMLPQDRSRARSRSSRAALALLTFVMPVIIIGLSACGNPASTSRQQAATNGTPTAVTATASAPAVASTATPEATATAYTGTATPLRTPASPIEATCRLIYNSGTQTAAALGQARGMPVGCFQLERLVVLRVPGAAADPRPGFLACAQPPAATDDYCGVGLAPVIARSGSYTEHWQFFPFPAADATLVGAPVLPQFYECVGNASQTWTFHLDTLTYTAGCTPPPSVVNGTTPCNNFLYVGMGTDPDLYATYGRPAACQLYGSTAVGVVDGNTQPGVIVCGPAAAVDQIWSLCGFNPGVPVRLDVWRFVPLPVTTGPVDSATFDTAAGTACLTVGAQSFTFTLATMAVTAGCAAGTATAAP